MAKRPIEPYYPESPPAEFEQWPRFIDDELHRIQRALTANPVAIGIVDSGTAPIDNPAVITQILIGATPVFEEPEGAFDPVTGAYTAPLGGFYFIAANIVIAPFGPGNKTYSAALEARVNGLERFTIWAGGADDVPLNIALSRPIVLVASDEVTFFLHCLHEQFAGSVNYDANLALIRMAGT